MDSHIIFVAALYRALADATSSVDPRVYGHGMYTARYPTRNTITVVYRLEYDRDCYWSAQTEVADSLLGDDSSAIERVARDTVADMPRGVLRHLQVPQREGGV